MHVRPILAVLFYVHLGNKYVFKSIDDADVRNCPLYNILTLYYPQAIYSVASAQRRRFQQSLQFRSIWKGFEAFQSPTAVVQDWHDQGWVKATSK